MKATFCTSQNTATVASRNASFSCTSKTVNAYLADTAAAVSVFVLILLALLIYAIISLRLSIIAIIILSAIIILTRKQKGQDLHFATFRKESLLA